jgi:hypothetical protein
MTNTAALALQLRTANREHAGIDRVWIIQIPTADEAARTLGHYADSDAEITAILRDTDGTWIGAGRTGNGSTNVSWA